MDTENGKAEGKMSGYLEKKGKLKVVSSYKKYWFVLEGQLLLYYRSKDEYEAISPCKGSVTLGPPCTLKPCSSHCGVFQISTRSTTVTLRAENLEEQNKWMQAIMVALKQNCSLPQKLSHFRYSLDELTTNDSVDKKPLARQNTLPERTSPKKNRKIIERLQKIGAQTYGGSMGQLPKLVRRSTKAGARCLSQDSLSSAGKNNLDRPEKCYSEDSINKSDRTLENFYERISSSESLILHREKTENSCLKKGGQGAVLFGNDSYCNLDRISVVRRSKEFNHTECADKREVDINENNYYVSQSLSSQQSQENAYSVSALCGSSNSLSKKNEHEYEDVEKFKVLRKYSSTNSDSSNNLDNSKSCAFTNFTRKLRHKSSVQSNDGTKNEKLKKSGSFLRRVWKRNKKKTNKTSTEDEVMYESVPKLVIATEDNIDNRIRLQNDAFQQVVVSLQNSDLSPQNAHKQNMQKETDEEFPVTHVVVKEIIVEDTDKDPKDNELLETRPELPPKKQKPAVLSPFHDVPTNNQPIAPPKKKKQTSIDDILRDLDQQKAEQSRSESPLEERKVKRLIKKFSKPESSDNEVVIRNKKSLGCRYEEIDSNELNRLLDELAKVTNAPIMTPGVTSSLISPNIVDDELKKFLPARQRRYSEPDYDIPRPHRSLVNLPKKDENALEATRFFGPILKPSDMEVKIESPIREDVTVWLSMTPDSLELDVSPRTTESHDEKVRTYNSHEYAIDTVSHDSEKFERDSHEHYGKKGIYAQPKQLPMVVSNMQEEKNNNFYAQNVRSVEIMSDDNENVFVDSLEICMADLKSTVF